MHDLSNTTRFTGNGETSWEDGDIGSNAKNTFDQELIRQADAILITNIFNYYRLHLDENNRKIVCPFSSHSGGRENTPSFNFYPKTNSFFCFGCKIGGSTSNFIAAMDNINRIMAAQKALSLFNGDDEYIFSPLDQQDFSEQMGIMMDFSNTVREFRKIHADEKSFMFIENICKAYDEISTKHKLSNDALRSVVKQLKEQILNHD